MTVGDGVTFGAIRAALDGVQTVVVASHLRPDGDALGSTIAMTLWLRSMGKEVLAWNHDGMPDKYTFLPESGLVTVPPLGGERRRFDALVALDTSVEARLGSVLDAMDRPDLVINMDHHISNEGFGTMNYVDAVSPATGQIVYEFLVEQGAEITHAIAANLFAAISTDTGSFQYTNTTSRTFSVAAGLVAAGIDVGALSQAIYDTQPRRRLELLRLALNSAQFTCDGRVASFSLARADVERLGLKPEDNEGIIDHLRAVEGVVAAVFFEETGDGNVRMSARSKDAQVVDVCRACAEFGGGGHALAAGARVSGKLADIEARFLAVLCNEIGRAD